MVHGMFYNGSIEELLRGHPCRAAGLGCAGYVANSPYTVLGDCLSAGRLYDKIGREATSKVVYVLENAVVCKVKLNGSESLCNNNLPQPETAGLHIL